MNKIILLVEDSLCQREALCTCLEDMGYLVIPYGRGDKAIMDIREGIRYDLAIIDRGLEKGGYDGDDVMKISTEFNPRTPIICVSGFIEPSPYTRINIPKPIEFRELERILIMNLNSP